MDADEAAWQCANIPADLCGDLYHDHRLCTLLQQQRPPIVAAYLGQLGKLHVDKQVDGLVLFGTQPSSHVKVRITIRAWLERLYPCQDTTLL